MKTIIHSIAVVVLVKNVPAIHVVVQFVNTDIFYIIKLIIILEKESNAF